MTYQQILDSINNNVNLNGNENITGVVLNSVLRQLLTYVNDGYISLNDVVNILKEQKVIATLGTVNTTTNVDTFSNGVYTAQTSGTYNNLGGLVAKEGYYTLFRKTSTGWNLETEVLLNDSNLENNLNNAIETIGNTFGGIKVDTYDSYYMSTDFSVNTDSMMLSESIISEDNSNLLYIEANFQSSGIVTLFVTDAQVSTILKIITLEVKSGFGRYYLNTVSLDRQNRIGISKDSAVKIRKCTSTVTGDETEFVRSLVVTGNIQVGASIGYQTSVNQILEMKYGYIYK